MKRNFRQKYSKYFAREKNAVPFLTSNAGKISLALLLAVMLVILGAREGRTDMDWPPWWQKKVRKLKAEGKDVIIIRSKNMQPETSPEEFLKRYKKIREEAGDKFTFRTFVEDVSRGLLIKQRYDEFDGIFYERKEDLNPNYYWRGLESMSFRCKKFCITPEMLRKTFGKEDWLRTYQGEKRVAYGFNHMGIDFIIDYITDHCCPN